MSKILMRDVKPGMTVQAERATGLIIAIRTKDSTWPNSYTYMPDEDYYDGPMTGAFKPKSKERVKVITGAARTEMIKRIQRQIRKRIYGLRQDLETIDLVNSITADADVIK